MLDLAVIGGGAAGFFAAINTKRKHPDLQIAIFERSKTVLGKVSISGGGRCNVTHACFDNRLLTEYYPRGRKELLSVFQKFNPQDTIKWFEAEGIILKSESDGRIFPISDDSQTIIDCFIGECRNLGIPIYTGKQIRNISFDQHFNLELNEEFVESRKVLVAAGSSDFFWNILNSLGHTIIPPVPSLFTFNIKNPFIEDLMGLSVQKASVSLVLAKEEYKKFGLKSGDLTQTGPLLITHWGLSGPAILKLSSVAARLLHFKQYRFEISVNLSNLKAEDLLEKLMLYKKEFNKKQVLNTPLFGIPQRWWQRIHSISFENAVNIWADLSKKELATLASHLCAFKLEVNGKSTFKEEFVTAGGVDLKEIDFKTMESKIIPGMYLAGEVLNIDALTGGFNFQAAWSEAWLVSESI